MTPEQFLSRLKKQPVSPAYLFLGQEGYQRRMCKQALLDRALPGSARPEGLTQADFESTTLSEVLDDARSLSLFSAERVIWICNAEAALPRRTAAAEADHDGFEKSPQGELAAYLKAPTPGTVLVFECSRYDFSGDDRVKIERVQNFYSHIPAIVEFRQFTPESLRFLALDLAKQHRLRLGGAELAALLEAVGGDANRLAAEIEKLSLFAASDRIVTADDLRLLVPDAAQATVFELVNAVARKKRSEALMLLQMLVREREYLPLALTFLNTQFRLALAAKEARLSSAYQAINFFTKMGVRIWRDRAEQVVATANAFSREDLTKTIALIYDTDKKFREGYRDDQVVMESLVLALTSMGDSNV